MEARVVHGVIPSVSANFHEASVLTKIAKRRNTICLSCQGLFLHNSLFSSFTLIAHTSKTIGASAPLRSVVTQQNHVFGTNAAGSRRPREQRDDMGPCLSKGGPVSARDRNGRRNPAPPHSTPRDAPRPAIFNYSSSPSSSSDDRALGEASAGQEARQARRGRQWRAGHHRPPHGHDPRPRDRRRQRPLRLPQRARLPAPTLRAPPTPGCVPCTFSPDQSSPAPARAPDPERPRDSNRDRSSARASSAPPTSSPTR